MTKHFTIEPHLHKVHTQRVRTEQLRVMGKFPNGSVALAFFQTGPQANTKMLAYKKAGATNVYASVMP